MMKDFTSMYLDTIKENLGSLFSFAVVDLKNNPIDFYNFFSSSFLAKQIEILNPKYLGESYYDWYLDLLSEFELNEIKKEYSQVYKKEYWIGYTLAELQFISKYSFSKLNEYGINYKLLSSKYIYHEADSSKIMDELMNLINTHIKNSDTPLSVRRKLLGFSQSELADMSGVSLRMIQLYEQKQNDISKASVYTVKRLSDSLKCRIEDIIN